MQLEIIAPEGWTPAFLAEWDRLLAEAAEPSIFLTAEWIAAWWRAFGADLEPRLLAGRDADGRLAGLAPLYLRRRRIPGRPRRLALMADVGAGSEYLGFLCRPGGELELVEAVERRLRGEWDFLEFRGLREPSALARLVPGNLGGNARRLVHRDRHACFCVQLPGDFEAYLASLRPDFRASVRHRTRKLQKSLPTRLLKTAHEAELPGHLERLFELHERRWAARGEPGVFHDQRKRAFYRDFAAAFLRRGWLRFFQLEVDGVIRASQLGFAYRGVLHSLQEAFDCDFRPPGIGGLGVVLRGMAIRECIGEGLRAYDFLGWEGEIKSRWGTGVHHVQRLHLATPTLRGALAFAAGPGWQRAKRWGRSRAPEWILRMRQAWRERQRIKRMAKAAAGV